MRKIDSAKTLRAAEAALRDRSDWRTALMLAHQIVNYAPDSEEAKKAQVIIGEYAGSTSATPVGEPFLDEEGYDDSHEIESSDSKKLPHQLRLFGDVMLFLLAVVSAIFFLAALLLKGTGLGFLYVGTGLGICVSAIATRLIFYFFAEVLDRLDSRT